MVRNGEGIDEVWATSLWFEAESGHAHLSGNSDSMILFASFVSSCSSASTDRLTHLYQSVHSGTLSLSLVLKNLARKLLVPRRDQILYGSGSHLCGKMESSECCGPRRTIYEAQISGTKKAYEARTGGYLLDMQKKFGKLFLVSCLSDGWAELSRRPDVRMMTELQ
jgi:hypothetical protein